MPGGGMPGTSGDEDGIAEALLALVYPRHRGHSGGGKPPPPTVRPMQHAGPLSIPERQAPGHVPVYQWSGAEEAAARKCRDKIELGAGLRGIQRTDTECFGI